MAHLPLKGKEYCILFSLSLLLGIGQICFSVFCLKNNISSKTQNTVFIVLGSFNTFFCVVCGVLQILAKNEKTNGKKIFWIRIKSIIYIITGLVSLFFLLIYGVLFETTELQEEVIGEKTLELLYNCRGQNIFY